ncbi:MAG: S1C family serine protease, partial [Clostridia bacterium]|nr:S1C family serine protease [Clostridia bacterium]
MKKRKAILALVTAALAGAISLSCAGCNVFVKQADTNFPYDGAVAGGFTGTEAEWLASQFESGTREHRLYEEAVQEGYVGSYLDFLKELGTGVTDDSAAVNQALTSVVAIENVYDVGRETETASGSGVIVSLDKTRGDAYIVTNYHVVYCVSSRHGTLGIGKNIKVYLYGGTTRPISATFYGGAMEYDIAVLKISGSEYLKETAQNPVYASACTVGDSDSLTVGQRVYAIGNPDGEGFSVTGGIVSVEAEYINVARADSSSKTISLLEIRTDAAVNHGNSGGGLFDASGRLVGIVNARSESSGVVA